jgi:hypothetical protein
MICLPAHVHFASQMHQKQSGAPLYAEGAAAQAAISLAYGHI